MRVAALFYLTEVQINGLHLGIQFHVLNVHHLEVFTTAKHGDVAVFQVDNLVGVFHYWSGIGTEIEVAMLANAHYQRALLACGNNLPGFTLVEKGDGIGTDDLVKGQLDGSERVQVFLHLNVFYELDKHFRICIRLESHALFYKLLLEFGIVFDDAVMNDSQISALRVMRMCIDR